MSEISNVRLKECRIKLTRLTREEILFHSGKSIKKTKKIADLTTDIKPKICVRKDIQTDIMDNKKTQDTEDTSNTGHEIMPDIITPQNIQNDGINNEEINDTQVEDDMYAGFHDFMPSMIYQQHVQNDMDTTEGSENIDNPVNEKISYIPNMMTIKQEIQDDNYDTYIPQVAGSSQIMIKQEVVDESYNYNNVFSTQDSHNMYSEYNIPNISNQPAQNFGMQSINPHIIIKQEVFDEGNIEVYTDVLRPSADQGYEDESPW